MTDHRDSERPAIRDRCRAKGLSNAEMAERLYMSVGAVKAHISGAPTRLGLNNRIQPAVLAHDARD